ncbi:helix-turn-helix transcriptional regulator [Streptomyces sp. NPDC001675]
MYPQRSSRIFLGRRDERAALCELLEGARRGHGGTVVVHGEPGIGKTALLDRAIASVPGLRALRVAGREYENELAFAGLHQLCAPLLDRMNRLSAPQRDALSVAFGLRSGAKPDRFHIGLAVLGMLSDVAEREPVVCVVDDAQWMDQESAQALAFVARRVESEAVALLFSLRELDQRQELAGLPTLHIEGLREYHARTLLTAQLHAPIDERVLDRVLGEARGNPLALLELPRGAMPDRWTEASAVPEAQTVTRKIEASFREQVAELPPATQMLLLVAAAEPLGDALLLWRAIDRLGISSAAALPAQTSHLLDIDVRVRFRHPLVRSAVYGAASADDKRRAHAALANVISQAEEPDRRAWHRGQASQGPDEQAAADLEASADRAMARGGTSMAAAFLRLAAALTPDPGLRVSRTLAAVQAMRDAGAPDEALDLLSAVDTSLLKPLQSARAEWLRAQLAYDTKRSDTAVTMLMKAAVRMAPYDTEAAGEAFLEAFTAAVFVGRFGQPRQLTDIAEAVRTAVPAPQPSRPRGLLLNSLITQATQGYSAAVPLLRDAVDAYTAAQDDHTASIGTLGMVCSAALDVWDDKAFRLLAERQVRVARADGAVAALPVALSYRALAYVHAGQLTEAAALIDEVHTITEAIGAPAMLYVDITLAAWRGERTRTLALAREVMKETSERGEGRMLTAAEYATAVLFNGLGRYDVALEACQPACDLDELSFRPWVQPEFVEAAARSSLPDLAKPAVERLEECDRMCGTPWARGMWLRSRALVTQEDEAEPLYLEAIDVLGMTESAVHHARAQLLYGEWLRRQGRRSDARAHLGAAYDTLASVGAAAFATRASRELHATGARLRRRKAEAFEQLTAQELRIARLVAGGSTSKEIGVQLFLSPRTVDAHLRNIFAKLGINSRRQLRDVNLSSQEIS